MINPISNELVLENLEAAIIVIDVDRVVRKVNIAAETLLEQSRRNLIGQAFEHLIPLPAVQKRLQECQLHNSQFTLREVTIDLPHKEMLVDITLSSLSSEQGVDDSVLIEINSINRISRFMKENNQLERQQSFRLMMRGLAHEIKNPLGGIRGAAQLLERELIDPEQQELTSILIKEADRLTRLVDRVMGSRDVLKLASINIHEVLEHVIDLLGARQGPQINIHRAYDPALPEILVDREQLIQAVLNIAVNALEAQQDCNSPSVGFNTQFERLVTINQTVHRQALKIQIWDGGPGVSKHMRGIIFDPLITDRPEGSGLGLSITQEIIQRHNGVVQLEDLDGKTCFSIYLPYLSTESNPRH